MNRIAIVGTGMIGRAWALVFAEAGLGVAVWDPDPAATGKAIEFVARQLGDMQRAGLLQESPDAIVARITPAATLQAALRDADYVQENGPEKLDLRREVFAELDRLAPEGAILASSTSGMPASSFTGHLKGRHRCLVAHPGNPPYLLPLVELCPSEWTSDDTLQRAHALMRRANRQPAIVRLEREGFVLNRLQGA